MKSFQAFQRRKFVKILKTKVCNGGIKWWMLALKIPTTRKRRFLLYLIEHAIKKDYFFCNIIYFTIWSVWTSRNHELCSPDLVFRLVLFSRAFSDSSVSFFMLCSLAWLSWRSSSVCKVDTLVFLSSLTSFAAKSLVTFEYASRKSGFSSPSPLTAHFYNML